MGALVSTSSLENAASVISGYPVTMAAWVNATGVSNTGQAFSLGQNVTRNSFNLGQGSNVFAMTADNGTAFQTTNLGSVTTANTWSFVVCRFISATNRRGSSLLFDGGITHAQGTTNVTMSGLTRFRIGQRADNTAQPWTGFVAECWYTNTDIQPDGLQLSSDTLVRLAYNGPFSIPSIANDVVEYRALRKCLTSDQDIIGSTYYNMGLIGGSRPTWTANSTVTLGQHPPIIPAPVPPDVYSLLLPKFNPGTNLARSYGYILG